MIYQFKSGAHVPSGADAGEVVAKLDDIKSRYGKLTAEAVADDAEAEPQDAVLRPWFTWDEELGMRKLHEIEAGKLIRSVVVAEIVPKHDVPVRAFVITHNDGETVYEHVEYVLTTEDRKAILVDQVEKEKAQYDAKFAELMQLIKLMVATP